MALLTCPECKNGVSEYAKTCASCNAPMDIIKKQLRIEANKCVKCGKAHDDFHRNLCISCYFASAEFQMERQKSMEQSKEYQKKLDAATKRRAIMGQSICVHVRHAENHFGVLGTDAMNALTVPRALIITGDYSLWYNHSKRSKQISSCSLTSRKDSLI